MNTSRPPTSNATRTWLLLGIGAGITLLCLGGLGLSGLLGYYLIGNRQASSPTTTRPPIAAITLPTATSLSRELAPTPIPTPTATATATATPTATATATMTPTQTPTHTPTPLPTPTLIPPTPTPPPTAVPVPTPLPPVALPPPPPAASMQSIAKQAILSLPGTSSGVFIDLSAPEALAVDDPEMIMPAGALINLVIAGATYEQVAIGRWSLADSFVLTAANRTEGTGVLKQRPLGTVFTLDQVVEALLVYSDNTAANMLIDRFGGFDLINNFASRNNLRQTTLRRRLFDQAAQARGIENTTSASDISILLLRLSTFDLINRRFSEQIINLLMLHAREDPNWLLTNLPPGIPAGHLPALLTGFRADAGFIIAGDRVYILVLFVRDPNEPAMERAIARVSAEIYQAMLRR